MVELGRDCSGLTVDDARFGAEFREIVNALFCACLERTETREKRLSRELFRLVEIDGRPLADAAGALGLAVSEAREMRARTRRDIAVLMALGLCFRAERPPVENVRTSGCRCHSGLGPESHDH